MRSKIGKKGMIGINVALVVILAIVVALIMIFSKKEYRLVKVENYEGQVDLLRKEKAVELFADMQLITEDRVTTGEDGIIQLLADSDKRIAAEGNTCFTIEASGDETKGNIRINLVYGKGLFTIENKLPEGSEFQVDTPNAVMSVRGTVFEVAYDTNTNTTTVMVHEGVVEAVVGSQVRQVNAGETLIIQDANITDGIYEPLNAGTDGTSDGATQESDGMISQDGAFAYTDEIAFYAIDDAGATNVGIKTIEEFSILGSMSEGETLYYSYYDEEMNDSVSIDYRMEDARIYDGYVQTWTQEKFFGEMAVDEHYVNDAGKDVHVMMIESQNVDHFRCSFFKEMEDGRYLHMRLNAAQPGHDYKKYAELMDECYYIIE